MRSERSCAWVTETIFWRDAQGEYWTLDPLFGPEFRDQFRDFGVVGIVARVARSARPEGCISVAALGMEVEPLPFFQGLSGFALAFPGLVLRAVTIARTYRGALLRLPGPIGSLLGLVFLARKRPIAVQMSGDPDTVLRAEGFSWAARRTRRALVAITRLLCHRAVSVAYVTRKTLQLLYPAGPGASCFSFSNVSLGAGDFVKAAPHWSGKGLPVLAFCGSLFQRYKGLDVLIEALALLSERDMPIRLDVAGDGAERPALEALAHSRGLGGHIRFLGQLPRNEVIAMLRGANLFVMPSRTEGLPRALVEAMAQGLPALGSKVGGIPELLPPDAMVVPDCPAALAGALASLLGDPARMEAMGAQNLEIARAFARERLDAQRKGFMATLAAAIDT